MRTMPILTWIVKLFSCTNSSQPLKTPAPPNPAKLWIARLLDPQNYNPNTMKATSKLIAALIVFIASFSDATAELVVGNMDVPPYFFEAIPLDGLFVSKAAEILDASDVSYTIATRPMARAYREFAEGKINVWVSFRSPRYEEYVLFSNRELFELDISVCSYQQGHVSLTDLHNQRVTVIRGHLMGNLIYYFNDTINGVTLDNVRNGEALVKMLINRRAKYIIGYHKSIEYYLDEYNTEHSQDFTFNCSSLRKEPVYMMIHKNTTNLEEYIGKINKRFPSFYSVDK